MGIKQLKIGSIVWDNESSDWFQVRSIEVLEFVNKNWGTRFMGIILTENNISSFFSDLEPSHVSESIIKYQLFKNDQMGKCVATFYGIYTRKEDPYFIPYSMSPEEDIAIQFGDGNDPFMGFYQLKNITRTFVRYVHELQNIFDSLIEYNKCTKRL